MVSSATYTNPSLLLETLARAEGLVRVAANLSAGLIVTAARGTLAEVFAGLPSLIKWSSGLSRALPSARCA